MTEAKPLKILLSDDQIQKRVAEMALEIRRDFPDGLHLIAVLKGAFIFLSDLVRNMPGHVSLDTLAGVVEAYFRQAWASLDLQVMG